MTLAATLQELLDARGGPCVSIYEPTHRHHPDNAQDPIRFANLLRTVRDSLARSDLGADAVEALVAPLDALAADSDFWRDTQAGLAVFSGAQLHRVVHLQRPVAERAIVADTFHVKPLIRLQQTTDRFHVLAIDRESVRLFAGNRDALDEIAPADGVPRSATDVVGDEAEEKQIFAHSYGTGPAAVGGGSARGPGGAKTGGVRHGQGSKSDLVEQRTERFFRAVDRAIEEHYSKPEGVPLILAGLAEHHAPFRAVSHNPLLAREGIDVHPKDLAPEALRERAWQVLAPIHAASMQVLVDRFGAARADRLALDDLAATARAAVAGRIDTVLLEAGRVVPGRIDSATGAISDAELANPAVDDLLDDIAELVLRRGGHVAVLDAGHMPTASGAAAILRY